MSGHWRLQPVAEESVRRIASEFELPEPLARVLLARAGDDLDAIRRWLTPQLTHLQDPSVIPGLMEAAERVARAVTQKEPIVVFGDYDADGMTAAALFVDFLERAGAHVRAVIPERAQGYGLSVAAVDRVRGAETALIVTVDNGISAADAVRHARDRGLDVIVTDHHSPPEELPPASVIVHPGLTEVDHEWRCASGAGVALALAIGVRRVLRESGWFRGEQPPLSDALVLAAIGTIADVVPLTGANRIIVAEGLRRLSRTSHPLLAEILRRLANGQQAQTIDAEFVAFRLAPLLNATGRLGQAGLGYRALRCLQPDEAVQLAGQLFDANQHRRRIEQQVMQSVERGLGDEPLPAAIVAAHPDWEHGVLGIAAGRLAESRQRPTILFQIQGDVAKGSGRTYGNLDLLAALRAAEDLCLRLGGHREAAGLTVPADRLAELRRRVCAAIAAQSPEAPKQFADALLPLSQVNWQFLEQLERLAPFGEGNPRPVFMSDAVRVRRARMLRGGHLQCEFEAGGATLPAIGFRFRGNAPQSGSIQELLYSPARDDYRGGASVQLRLYGLRAAMELRR